MVSMLIEHKKAHRKFDLKQARQIIENAEGPPVTFSEALNLYRQVMRGNFIFFRCRFN